MHLPIRLLVHLLVTISLVSKAPAQPAYMGTRVAVFDVEILQLKNQNLALRCRMANTGRQMVGAKSSLAEMVVEFDTNSVSALLRGHEPAIVSAVRNNCPKLKPGEISAPVWLTVRLPSRAPAALPGNTGCAALVFDTVFVEEWNPSSMRLRYFLKKIGTAPANFFAKKAAPFVNVFFVSGTKLTRGAIPAGRTIIQKGRETLDGMLLPGQMMEGTIEINLKDRSKFSPNIALEFDPAQTVEECGRSGNIWVLKLRY